ncbi:MAG: hypothetical protein K9N35_03240 [Candidatus Marinimicrobia bacterium]|nr:hypothetical protein [Candidatus Neomarinimicrobiota bacterium]
MKKLIVTILAILVVLSSALATDKRVQALGNDPYMLPGDDASIQLFPQRINDMNLVYFRDVHLASPDYLLVVGDPGKTWGFYGGSTEKDDYINVLRSLGSKSAIRLGGRFGIIRDSSLDDDKEAPPTTDEFSLSKLNMMMDFEFGMDMGDTEFSTNLSFGLTPDDINALVGALTTPHGSYFREVKSGASTTKDEGKASKLSFVLQTKARAKKGLFFFDNSYALFGIGYQGSSSEYTAANTKIEDQSEGAFSIYSSYHLFNNQNLANDKIFLVYGLGGLMNFSRTADENLLSGSESKDTDMSFGIVAPVFNIGLEAKLKYASLRFGMERMITSLGYSSSTQVYKSGLVDDEDTQSSFVLGANGIYNYNAGMGFNYGDLKLDVLINNNFWLMGPQMLFSGDPAVFGTFAICADIVYMF